MVGLYFYRRSGLARGFVSSSVFDPKKALIFSSHRNIRLPSDSRSSFGGDSGILSTLTSVPWFLVGLAGIAWQFLASNVESLSNSYRARRRYRNLPVDEDARILRFEVEE